MTHPDRPRTPASSVDPSPPVFSKRAVRHLPRKFRKVVKIGQNQRMQRADVVTDAAARRPCGVQQDGPSLCPPARWGRSPPILGLADMKQCTDSGRLSHQWSGRHDRFPYADVLAAAVAEDDGATTGAPRRSNATNAFQKPYAAWRFHNRLQVTQLRLTYFR